MIPLFNKLSRSQSGWSSIVIFVLPFLLLQVNLSAQSDTCPVSAGTLRKTSLCFQNDQTILKAVHSTNIAIPARYQAVYLLTHGAQQVIVQVEPEPVFILPTVDSLQGIYSIHTLVFSAASFRTDSLVLKATQLAAVNAQLQQGGGAICAALDMEGVEVQFGDCEIPCKANAGKLAAAPSTCLPRFGEITLRASVENAPIIPDGFARLYLFNDLEYDQILTYGNEAAFPVAGEGQYSIHTLVYDSTTLHLDSLGLTGTLTLGRLDSLLLQGGGAICGALDKTGARFAVQWCPERCQSDAGTLVATNNPCLSDGVALLKANHNRNPLTPGGFRVRYLLSAGAEQTVLRVGLQPSFSVSDTGNYTIHTLVYDTTSFQPETLPLGTINISTVRNTMDALCGVVDSMGAVFNINSCPPKLCTARPGLLMASDSTCLYNGRATVAAKIAVRPLEPFGYETIYLLTAGDSTVIEQMNGIPTFDVARSGRFVIHTLVIDTTAFKFDSIQIGETRIEDILALLLQGGGNICGALEINGLDYQVEECAACPADAGRIGSNEIPCLSDGKAILNVYNTVAPTVPSGFKIAYLLVGSNKIVQQVSDTASFVVEGIGAYFIHTLVYEFAAFDLSTIVPGTTTMNQIKKELIEGGGTQCGDLDLRGFSFFVLPCPMDCDAEAGTLTPTGGACLENGMATLEALTNQPSIIPDNMALSYLLSEGANKKIVQFGANPSFEVSTTGAFAIHAFVYDPQDVNLEDLVQNETRISDLAFELAPFGGPLCGDLNEAGATFAVADCSGFASPDAQLRVFPNPTNNNVQINLPKTKELVKEVIIELFDSNANVLQRLKLQGYIPNVEMDITGTKPGLYQIRVIYDGAFIQQTSVIRAQ